MGHNRAARCATINGEDGDTGVVGFLNGGHNGVGVGGIDEDGVNFLLDQIFDVGGFFGRIVLSIDGDQGDAGGIGGGLRAFA